LVEAAVTKRRRFFCGAHGCLHGAAEGILTSQRRRRTGASPRRHKVSNVWSTATQESAWLQLNASARDFQSAVAQRDCGVHVVTVALMAVFAGAHHGRAGQDAPCEAPRTRRIPVCYRTGGRSP
jgi:hypothetical protein